MVVYDPFLLTYIFFMDSRVELKNVNKKIAQGGSGVLFAHEHNLKSFAPTYKFLV